MISSQLYLRQQQCYQSYYYAPQFPQRGGLHAFKLSSRALYSRKNGGIAYGTITSVYFGWPDTIPHVEVTFQIAEKSEIYKGKEESVFPRLLKEGKAVTVLYDPKEPSRDVQINPSTFRTIGSIFLGLVTGLVCFFATGFFLYSSLALDSFCFTISPLCN